MSNTVAIILMMLAVVGGFAVICLYFARENRRTRLYWIRRRWGQRPDREYSFGEFEAISHYHKRKTKKGFVLDDITWNDLDMDTIFMLLNNTNSCIGESYLYDQLRTLSWDSQELKERSRMADFFAAHPREREKVSLFFAEIGKTGTQSIFDCIYNLSDYKEKSNLVHYLCIAGVIASIGITFLVPAAGVMLLFCVIAFSWTTYFKMQKEIRPYQVSCRCLLVMLKTVEDMEKLNIPELMPYVAQMKESVKKFQKFRKNTLFVLAGSTGNKGTGGGVLNVVFDYLNYTFHFDLLQFQVLVRELKNHMDSFEVLIEKIGFIEASIAVASFREMMGTYCEPELSGKGQLIFETENMYHPMIDEPVKNSISVKRGALITGSNASGKSTFLKTAAINGVLAQTIYTVLADRFHSCFSQIYSSMALRDDLAGEESYYIVEIKSLKRILDRRLDDIPVLCFVDEVLRGTNTVERIAASSRILRSLAKGNAICFAATHDIELTHILEKEYDNYHFQEEVTEDDVIFDYRLYDGRAISRNAIKLLSVMGYDEDVVKEAEEAAMNFMETGNWA